MDLNNDNRFDLVIKYYNIADSTFYTDVMVYDRDKEKFSKYEIENISNLEALSGTMIADIDGDGRYFIYIKFH